MDDWGFRIGDGGLPETRLAGEDIHRGWAKGAKQSQFTAFLGQKRRSAKKQSQFKANSGDQDGRDPESQISNSREQERGRRMPSGKQELDVARRGDSMVSLWCWNIWELRSFAMTGQTFRGLTIAAIAILAFCSTAQAFM
ncbi:MAG: hypothetical protein JSW27_09640, partial [Phycisphaerales bacterium]